MTPFEWALNFAFGLDGVMTVLSGMSTLEQVEQNLATFAKCRPLNDEEMACVMRAQEKFNELIAVPCTGCKYCMKGCPQDINIAGIMEALNREKIYGHKVGASQYGFCCRNHGKASDCIQCGQCETCCPQSIPIVSTLERAVKIFESEAVKGPFD